MPKEKLRHGAVPLRESLEQQINADSTSGTAASKSSKRRRPLESHASHGDSGHDTEETGERFVPAQLTQKILRQAREQQLDEDGAGSAAIGSFSKKRVQFHAVAGQSDETAEDSGDEAADGWRDEGDDEEVAFGGDDEVEVSGDYIGARLSSGAAKEDLSVLRRFMPEDSGSRRTLADIIMDKLAQVEARQAQAQDEEDGQGQEAVQAGGLDPRVISVYSDVGKYLTSYRSGKLPKVMKVVPSLARWEEVLFLTNPESWTPHATYAVTRVFASNLNAAKAQRFYNLILLPKVRDDIFIHKKLNFHLYLALRKATYKPAAFYRGILLPLAAGGDCTLLEAVIVASVVKKSSIPQLHSAAALVKLAGLPYSGAVSVFMSALLDKKYTLPYLAVDAVVEHFTGFTSVPGPLPVLWHTCLLSLARRYKADLTAVQKDGLRKLMSVHSHPAISAEVRRELSAAANRGEGPLAPVPGQSGSAASTSTAVPAPQASHATGSQAASARQGPKAKAGTSRQRRADEDMY